MEPCNSHKCSCSRCMTARRSAEVELDPRDRLTRLDKHVLWLEERQQRREAWKRSARRHHIDRAGVCCAPREFCTCPNCVEVRREAWKRFSAYYAKVWGRVPREFCMCSNPNSVESWVRSMFTDPPAYMSLAEATEFYPASLSTPKVKASFLHGDWTYTKQTKEHPMLNGLQLAILAYYSAFPSNTRWPGSLVPVSVAEDVHDQLIRMNLLERIPETERGFRLSERGQVLLTAIRALPLPVRQPSPWTMPI